MIVARRWRSGPDEQPRKPACKNHLKKHKKQQKRTHLTGAALKRIRLDMGFAPRDMCAELGLPRRTYQDYESGKRSIPENIAIAAATAHQRNREFFQRLPGRIYEQIARQFPNGIPSSKED